MTVVNKDHQSWLDRMSPGPMPATPEPLTRPRPGHADLAGGLKYDRHDLRDILERASARETASRVAVGSVCRRLLEELGIDIFAHVISIGDVDAQRFDHSFADMKMMARKSDLACLDADAEQRMKEAIHAAAHAGDTLGGVFEVIATGVMPGLGSHTQWDRKLDGRLAQAMCSIQAIKAVEIGDGWQAARSRGSQVHDAIEYGKDRQFHRPTNRAGGLEGGITNGAPLVVRAAMKPIATLKKALPSVDVVSKEAFDAAHERSDICAVAAASIVGEAMVAITLCDAVLEKFGSDSLRELKRNVEGYLEQNAEF
jgi:chorismate synthase